MSGHDIDRDVVRVGGHHRGATPPEAGGDVTRSKTQPQSVFVGDRCGHHRGDEIEPFRPEGNQIGAGGEAGSTTDVDRARGFGVELAVAAQGSVAAGIEPELAQVSLAQAGGRGQVGECDIDGGHSPDAIPGEADAEEQDLAARGGAAGAGESEGRGGFDDVPAVIESQVGGVVIRHSLTATQGDVLSGEGAGIRSEGEHEEGVTRRGREAAGERGVDRAVEGGHAGDGELVVRRARAGAAEFDVGGPGTGLGEGAGNTQRARCRGTADGELPGIRQIAADRPRAGEGAPLNVGGGGGEGAADERGGAGGLRVVARGRESATGVHGDRAGIAQRPGVVRLRLLRNSRLPPAALVA